MSIRGKIKRKRSDDERKAMFAKIQGGFRTPPRRSKDPAIVAKKKARARKQQKKGQTKTIISEKLLLKIDRKLEREKKVTIIALDILNNTELAENLSLSELEKIITLRKRKKRITVHPIIKKGDTEAIVVAGSIAQGNLTLSEATIKDDAAGVIVIGEAESAGQYVSKRVTTTVHNLGGGVVKIVKTRKNQQPVSITDVTVTPPVFSQIIENDFRKWQKTGNKDFKPNNNQIRTLVIALSEELEPFDIKVRRGKLSVQKQINEIKRALKEKDRIKRQKIVAKVIEVPAP